MRMDKTAYVLTYPSRPLVDTRLMNFIKLDSIPSGHQIHVAIMSHTGYNQEDSVCFFNHDSAHFIFRKCLMVQNKYILSLVKGSIPYFK